MKNENTTSTAINKKITLLSHKTYHGNNMDTIEFELNNLKYYGNKQWNNEGKTTQCKYGRILKNEYYDTIQTLYGEFGGMHNKQPKCEFGNLPEDLFDSIASLPVSN